MQIPMLRAAIVSLACCASLCAAEIKVDGGRAVIKSGILERVVQFGDGRVRSTAINVDGRSVLASTAKEFTVAVTREQQNRKPRGLTAAEATERNDFASANRARWRAEGFDPSRYDDTRPDAPKWVDYKMLEARAWNAKSEARVTKPAAGATRLTITSTFAGDALLDGVSIDLNYEAYDGYPAIRKWAVVRNAGKRWLKLERMNIDDVHLSTLTRKQLAAAMFGVQPSVVAFESPGSRYGVIAASEVPSALRTYGDDGSMGYTATLFEWVVGPGEQFTSEAVFHYAFSGAVRETVSAPSTPLDRAIEGPYMQFLHRIIGVAAEKAPMHGPQYLTWAYFYANIDDKLVRELTDIASRAGFTEMLLDDGWQKGRLGTEIDTKKFPDFGATADFVRSKGMVLGLWVSCFRDTDSRDMADMPEARILPPLIRSTALPGLAMSYASNWRDYVVKDLIQLARRYQVKYYKQDFTNIMYGDLAEGHESRTRRESLLRGLRGLLEVQDMLRKQAPEIVNEITHEIYWGTPGVPADIAALRTTARFHIPPNECFGSDLARDFRGRQVTAEAHAAMLRQGCWLARQRFYSHRGLPLYPLEFYAATTANFEGSLSPQVQDRQVASWLMGAPANYSGDLRTLTAAQVAHYRKRLDEVKRLEKTYGIYRHFQFSGVPEPTDTDWHWWGKLNAQGQGAVVVVRGSEGAAHRMVNVPWVKREASYRVTGLFSGKSYGVVTGAKLQDSGLDIALPVYGQDVLEIAAAK